MGRLVPDDSNFDNPSFQNQSYAVESTGVNSLPTSQFKKGNKEEQRPSHTDCAVCLGEFEEGEWLRHLLSCKHALCISCIDTWFQSHSSCPLCRSCVYDQTVRPECSVSMFTILETVRRNMFCKTGQPITKCYGLKSYEIQQLDMNQQMVYNTFV